MIIKVTSDKERVKSILKLIENREKFVSSADFEQFATIITENYYEIIKELATCMLLLDGLKTVGEGAHKELINYLSNYNEFGEYEINLMDDLRIKRNQSFYEGKKIDKRYLENKEDRIISIIKNMKKIISKKLSE